MKIYADYDFYVKKYLLGRNPVFHSEDFAYWASLASAEIRKYTYRRLETMNEIPEEAKMCCCNVAEKIYSFESLKDEDGRILHSYSNDGDSGTYVDEDYTEDGLEKAVYQIIHKWLSFTDLLYCGVN